MEVLRGSRDITDLDIVVGAGLKKTFEAGTGMLGALSFVTVRQKQHNTARQLPLRFSRNNELIDDDLCAVGEVAELRLPKTQHLGIIERISVVKTEDGGFGQKAIVNTEARLIFGEMQQRDVGITRLGIVNNRMPSTKGAAS